MTLISYVVKKRRFHHKVRKIKSLFKDVGQGDVTAFTKKCIESRGIQYYSIECEEWELSISSFCCTFNSQTTSYGNMSLGFPFSAAALDTQISNC